MFEILPYFQAQQVQGTEPCLDFPNRLLDLVHQPPLLLLLQGIWRLPAAAFSQLSQGTASEREVRKRAGFAACDFELYREGDRYASLHRNQEVESQEQCDQIWRFIGLWATF